MKQVSIRSESIELVIEAAMVMVLVLKGAGEGKKTVEKTTY